MILFAIWTAVLPIQHALGQGGHEGHAISDTAAGRSTG